MAGPAILFARSPSLIALSYTFYSFAIAMAQVNGNSIDSARHFKGCSSIADYEVIDKLGEGTFGYAGHCLRLAENNQSDYGMRVTDTKTL